MQAACNFGGSQLGGMVLECTAQLAAIESAFNSCRRFANYHNDYDNYAYCSSQIQEMAVFEFTLSCS